METMRERLAAAGYRAAAQTLPGPFADARWEDASPANRDMWLDCVDAILAELERPDEGMVRAGNVAGFKSSVRTVSRDVFTAMIQSIRSPTP